MAGGAKNRRIRDGAGPDVKGGQIGGSRLSKSVSSSVDADSFRRDDDERELIDAGEVAQMLGMTIDWVYEQSRRGRIPTITLGHFRRYRRAAIETWLLSIERASVDAVR